jgi:hypothetical protein
MTRSRGGAPQEARSSKVEPERFTEEPDGTDVVEPPD